MKTGKPTDPIVTTTPLITILVSAGDKIPMMHQRLFSPEIDLTKITEEKERGIITASNQAYPL